MDTAAGADPFPSEVPEGLNILPEAFDDGPLAEDDVPPTSYVERLTIGDEETALSGKALWQSRTTLLPTCAALIQMLEDVHRRDEGLPELHRSARLAEANAAVDEEELLDFFGLDELPGLLAIGEGGGEHFEGEERARLEGGDASANGEGERFYAGEHERFLVKEGGRTRFFEEDLRFWDGDAPSLFILLGDGEHSVLGR
ncbi:hypothetical protein PC128_g10364 [Phytophthora cactorum]|nr:hypothetical protein PC128_g10364 [Phytophthora cactorum]